MFEIVLLLLGGASVVAFNRVKTIFHPKAQSKNQFKTIGYFTTSLEFINKDDGKVRKCTAYTIAYEDGSNNRKVEFRFSLAGVSSSYSIDLIKSGDEYITLIQPWLEKSITTQQLIEFAGEDFHPAKGGKEEITPPTN